MMSVDVRKLESCPVETLVARGWERAEIITPGERTGPVCEQGTCSVVDAEEHERDFCGKTSQGFLAQILVGANIGLSSGIKSWTFSECTVRSD